LAVTKLTTSNIRPCLWFDTQAEDAANFYTTVFENSSITRVTRRGETAPGEAGTVLTVEFEVDGQEILALNGGPQFTFTEAISFQVYCETQEEVDRLWSTLSDGGEEGPCGWLKDRFGLSWQIVPTVLPELLSGSDQARVDRAMTAMLGMGKLDIQALVDAADGSASQPHPVGA
jgi:predicted 3-demethylubiquinone-9 3-methyltransferase (glyoxalase superfamily)